MSRYVQWSRTARSEPTRIGVTLLAGPVFLGVLPFVVAGIGPRLDRRLGLPALGIAGGWRILGGALAVAGFSLGFWSVSTQLDRGRGTPLPIMPTQELLMVGPFRYCRNPMTLGAILAYLGIALVAWVVDAKMSEMLPDLAIPLAVAPSTLLAAVGIGVVVVGLAPLLMSRRLRRMDLPGTLRLVE